MGGKLSLAVVAIGILVLECISITCILQSYVL